MAGERSGGLLDKPWAWASTVGDYIRADLDEILAALDAHHLRCCSEPADDSNRRAWRDSLRAMRSALVLLMDDRPSVAEWFVIHEYELPRERGRRPDVVLIAGGVIVVLEFKGHDVPMPPHIDQVEAYVRDLSEYHRASHGRPIGAILVPTRFADGPTQSGQTVIAGTARLASAVAQVTRESESAERIDPHDWLESEYAPLPSLVTAARIIFNHEPLPHIRRAESAGIPRTLEALESITSQAYQNGESHLALITGVPGAGKTLVGLQYVYGTHFGEAQDDQRAVFLSGNGPLVKVLQHTLKSRVFVRDVLGFLKTYGAAGSAMPYEHIWVFDEAQRAFDAEMALEKRGAAVSEPEDFLRLGERLDSWAVMVGLIGQGQEINRGEEAGLGQWNDALAAMDKSWTVHCPSSLVPAFSAATRVNPNDSLDLDVTLRSHRAESTHLWVSQLLDGRITECKTLSRELHGQGFEMYVTRDIEAARLYVRERYKGLTDARFGLLASSKARNLSGYGFLNEYQFTKNMRVGPWFADPPESSYSCCALRDTATEFQCQGLELDMPIIGWGHDLWWTGSGWDCSRRYQVKDPRQIRLNAYRVLLTRGRDGFIVFVPPEPKYTAVFEVLEAAGCTALSRIWL